MERATGRCLACCPSLHSGGEGSGRPLLCTSQNKGDPAVLACLRDLSGAPPALAHLYHGFDVWTRGSGKSNWQFIRPLEVATAQRRVPHAPPRHMCLLEGMTWEDLEEEYDGSPTDIPLSAGDYATYFSTRLKKHRTPAYYRAEAEAKAEAEAEAAAPAGPAGAALGDVPFPPGMEVALDPALGLQPAIIIPADLRQAPPPLQLDPEHATYVPAQRYQELCRRFGFARSYIARLYSERHEKSRQSNAVTQLQLEVDRLQTRLEVERIPLDFSEDEEDDDGSSSDDALPSPPPQAVAGLSQRRR
ncbi:hypothetical protein JCGZ_22321 [Jatropha curcas]|uniref:Uncharacterized protein n=1 Tax=Jatropha curcas TaxID=180498 RepID=A0A067JR08_JATCU|nr:hypothetical protein JCGZ_22321 [Jatropha curcas]